MGAGVFKALALQRGGDLSAEYQPDLWPESLDYEIHLQPSNGGGLSLNSLINREGGLCTSLSPVIPALSMGWGGEESNQASNDSYYQQCVFSFNLCYIDHGISLAPNGSWTKQDLTVERDARELIDELVNEYRAVRNLKRLNGNYVAAFDMVLANLLRVAQRDQQLLVSLDNTHAVYPHRNPGKITNYIINRTLKFLGEHDYIAIQVGRANEHQQNASWCIPLPKLITRLEQAKARVMLRSNAILAELRERGTKHRTVNGRIIKDKGKPIQPPPSSREHGRLKKLEQSARSHNETWLNNSVTLDGRVVLPWLRRVFTESTALGGRFYGYYQSIPSEDRKRIRINGEQTVELDFKSMHPAILYAWEDTQLESDPYLVDGFSRDAVKAVFLVLANTENLPSLKAQITRSGKPENQAEYARYRTRLYEYERMRACNLKCERPELPVRLQDYIEGLPENVLGGDLVNAILDAHPLIAHHFGTTDIGLKLQREDSNVMGEALTLLQGVPVLPIHDSIRCRVSDINRVYDAMTTACINTFGQVIQIDEK